MTKEREKVSKKKKKKIISFGGNIKLVSSLNLSLNLDYIENILFHFLTCYL